MEITKKVTYLDIPIINLPIKENELDFIDIEIDNIKIDKKYKLDNELNYIFLWKFKKADIYKIKVIFKFHLLSCEKMFYICKNISEIDLTKFDASRVTSCLYMFAYCTDLKKIRFGENDFSLVNNFSYMFLGCENLVDLDVSNFNTQNSKTFSKMFYNCHNLKSIDVSNFNSSKCESIHGMFCECHKITEIDMFNWDLSKLKWGDDDEHYYSQEENPIDFLFYACTELKKIKISGNAPKEVFHKSNLHIYSKLPSYDGEFIINKKYQSNNSFYNHFPVNWNRIYE